MNFVEFIGFVIVILAMFFILIRRAMEERRRRKYPELFEKEEQEREKALKEFLRGLNVDVEEVEELKPEPPPLPKAVKLEELKPKLPIRS